MVGKINIVPLLLALSLDYPVGWFLFVSCYACDIYNNLSERWILLLSNNLYCDCGSVSVGMLSYQATQVHTKRENFNGCAEEIVLDFSPCSQRSIHIKIESSILSRGVLYTFKGCCITFEYSFVIIVWRLNFFFSFALLVAKEDRTHFSQSIC